MPQKYTPTDKEKIIKRFFKYRQTMPDLRINWFAKGAGIKSSTIYQWLRLYKAKFKFGD